MLFRTGAYGKYAVSHAAELNQLEKLGESFIGPASPSFAQSHGGGGVEILDNFRLLVGALTCPERAGLHPGDTLPNTAGSVESLGRSFASDLQR